MTHHIKVRFKQTCHRACVRRLRGIDAFEPVLEERAPERRVCQTLRKEGHRRPDAENQSKQRGPEPRDEQGWLLGFQ